MLNIAVIEDNNRDAKILEQCLTRYASQNHLQFQITRFSSALKFINAYKSNYDLIFMDIEMPLMSGMEAAKALRQIDRCDSGVCDQHGAVCRRGLRRGGIRLHPETHQRLCV